VVAGWDPEWIETAAPARRERGWIARLAREVDAAMVGHDLTLSGGHVYHVVLAIPERDGALGDATWRELVDDAVHRMGFGADAEGRGGCRWVAVHHGRSTEGNDHVHLVVNLVRGDGTVADTYRDWPRWRAWCLDTERRLGLTATSPANKTAPRRPTRAEKEKAARLGRERTSREQLRDEVRAAASRASSAAEFLQLLTSESRIKIDVQPRWTADGVLTGYKVGLPIDYSTSSPDGRVWFGGSTLARDLSAPKLMQRWASAPAPPPSLPHRDGEHPALVSASFAERRAALADAHAAATRAGQALAAHIAHGTGDDGNGDVISWPSVDHLGLTSVDHGDGIAHAALDLMVATGRAMGNDASRVATAATIYERAAATAYLVQPTRWAPVAAELRRAARRLSRAGVQGARGNTGVAVVALLMALASLLTEIASWRDQTRQPAQADAARTAAAAVTAEADALVRDHSSIRLKLAARREPAPALSTHEPSSTPRRRANPTSSRPNVPQPTPKNEDSGRKR
jgi:hypothetical protein